MLKRLRILSAAFWLLEFFTVPSGEPDLLDFRAAVDDVVLDGGSRSVFFALEVATDDIPRDETAAPVLEELEVTVNDIVSDSIGSTVVFQKLKISANIGIQSSQTPGALYSLYVTPHVSGVDQQGIHVNGC